MNDNNPNNFRFYTTFNADWRISGLTGEVDSGRINLKNIAPDDYKKALETAWENCRTGITSPGQDYLVTSNHGARVFATRSEPVTTHTLIATPKSR